MSAFTTLIAVAGSLTTAIRQEEKNLNCYPKSHPNFKKAVKLTLVADGLLQYIESPTDSTKNLLELINAFSRESGHKINI